MSEPVPQRMDVDWVTQQAAKAISPVLWNQRYVYGRGPLHFASAIQATLLLEKAAEWRRLANNAEIVAAAIAERPLA